MKLTSNIKAMVGHVMMEVADLLDDTVTQKAAVIGVTIPGSELGPTEIFAGCHLCQRLHPSIQVVPIGHDLTTDNSEEDCQREAHKMMNDLLVNKRIDAAVTMHYNFPVGVATVGRMITPSKGREVFLASTTGTTAANRVQAMVMNTIYGVAVAKASGIGSPKIGFLNVDGARAAARIVSDLVKNGYEVEMAGSVRVDGGMLMRGNDLLAGTADVMVTDSLTGNILMKVMSSFNTGGSYEAVGFGYGPGVGEGFDPIILIVSRTSGAPVIASAIRYAADMVVGKLNSIVLEELARARKHGLDQLIFEYLEANSTSARDKEVVAPMKKIVTEEILGIDILALDDAVHCLWSAGIYGETGMGCTGPVILVAEFDREQAKTILIERKYL
jgi:hypothetical protein